MDGKPLVGINGLVSKNDEVGFLATIIGPSLRKEHPLPWRVEPEGDIFHILDKADQLVMPFELRIQAERFIAFVDENSPERLSELMSAADEARFQADWVERNGGLAALIYGVPRLRRATSDPP